MATPQPQQAQAPQTPRDPYAEFGGSVASAWNPTAGEPVAHIVTSDGQPLMIHGDDLAEAQRRDPNLKVLRNPHPHDPYAEFGGTLASAVEPQPTGPAAKPGAYQQTKAQRDAHVVHNVNEDAARPFSDTTTSVIGNTGAMMKRDDETDSQFMTRAIQAGRNVTQAQIDSENAENKKLAVPTLGIAAAAGPAMLSLEVGAGAAFDYAAEKLGLSAAEDMGLKEWVEQMGERMPTVLDKAAGAAKAAIQWMGQNPVKTYLIYKTARELGLPLGKLLHLASSAGE